MFMAMPASTKQQVAAILMGKVVVNGTEQAVTVRDFSGKMVQYNQLLAELLRWNLADFFTYMADVLKPAIAMQESQAQ
jgi:hypothetical protein